MPCFYVCFAGIMSMLLLDILKTESASSSVVVLHRVSTHSPSSHSNWLLYFLTPFTYTLVICCIKRNSRTVASFNFQITIKCLWMCKIVGWFGTWIFQCNTSGTFCTCKDAVATTRFYNCTKSHECFWSRYSKSAFK